MRPHHADSARNTFVETVLALEELISERLSCLGVTNTQTRNVRGESPYVDLRVQHPSGNPAHDLEVRITFGTRGSSRLRNFVKDSLRTTDRGIRIYMEVFREDFRARCDSIYLCTAEIVDRIAYGLKDIIHRYRDFGPYRLMGVRVYANPKHRAMERIQLLRRAYPHRTYSR